MPCKDAALYLAACLDSIVGQSLLDWELIVVDDHSQDKSYDLLLAYAKKDPRIKPTHSDGHGIIDALRKGYRLSTGSLITRMDADDIMPSKKLEILSRTLLAHGSGHVSTGCVNYFSEEKQIGPGYQRYARWLNELTRAGANFSDIYRECVIPSPCWMLSREDFDLIGGFEHDRYPEDYDLVFRMAQADMTAIPQSEILHHWRDHEERASRNDPNYLDNRFIEIKCHYFLHWTRDASRRLVLWGTGDKGKAVAKMLIAAKEKFSWLCNNEKKIGQDIYGVKVMDSGQAPYFFAEAQTIIAVSNPEAQMRIEVQLKKSQLRLGRDYHFFC